MEKKCSNCGWYYESDEIHYYNGNMLCNGCYEAELEYEEDENSGGYYGPNSDSAGICDYCGKSRKYGNCTCV